MTTWTNLSQGERLELVLEAHVRRGDKSWLANSSKEEDTVRGVKKRILALSQVELELLLRWVG